eukprot:806393-Amphidinium_carterae.1
MQGVEDEREMEDIESPPIVRVDDSMDRRVPVDADGPEAVVTRLAAVADGPEVVGPVCRVGPHLCHLTDGDTRITCKKCERYVTTYKGSRKHAGRKAEKGKHPASKAV